MLLRLADRFLPFPAGRRPDSQVFWQRKNCLNKNTKQSTIAAPGKMACDPPAFHRPFPTPPGFLAAQGTCQSVIAQNRGWL
jgi:hypothetical protein